MGHKRILVPMDGSENSMQAAEWAINLAQACEAELEFLYVVNLKGELLRPTVLDRHTSILEDAIDLGKRLLDTALDLVPISIKARGHCVSGDADETILKEVQALSCDMIVMGSRGIGAIHAAILGSVSGYILEHAKCPVVMIKAEQKEK